MALPLTTNTVDAAALADELVRFRVVDPTRLHELLSGFCGIGPVALADYLVGRGALTAFQAERALAGEARRLVLGPYRLTGPAGRGTFGPLFTARHTSKPGAFVIRVLPLRSLWKARQAKRVVRSLATGINHPAVAPVVDLDSANGFHYLVWPHSPSARLVERVSTGGPLPPGQAAALLGHLASALAACHARGAVHGALTPHSVALGSGGLPLLQELGAYALLVQNVVEDESLFDSLSAAFACGEVLAFAAPELADAPAAPAPEVDQYALGAVGYFALTGLRPYPHPALADQLRAKRAGPPPSAAIVNPAVPTELAAVIERMMAPDPAERFTTLGELEERLAALAVSEPVAEAVPTPPPVVEPLMLSRPTKAYRLTGAISWNDPESGTLRPARRDGSDACVTFDLPEAAETVPGALPVPPPRIPAAEPERSRAGVETPYNVPFAARPEGVERGAPDSAVPVEAPPVPHDPHLTAPSDVPGPDQPKGPPPGSVLWKKLKRNLLFWQRASETVQVSVFAPAAVAPGQSVRLAVYLHRPDAGASVRTLSRAFQYDAELIGSGYLLREVARESELAVHVSVANAGVAQALLACQWRGQPQLVGFELHVPWESPDGAAPGLISIGLNNVRIGKIEFHLNVLPRKA
jgi:serine/threonine protein kinase